MLVNTPATTCHSVLVLAHGAGAPMDSDYMNCLCAALNGQGIATVRFEFPYMAARRRGGSKRPPDRQPVLLDCWRAIYREVVAGVEGVPATAPVLIGGKSMGGRMASLVADELGAAGLCCFGYPFHPPGKPETMRTGHFAALKTPTCIVQGTRDPFGKPGELDESAWSPVVRLHWIEEGDHDLKVRKSSGLTQTGLIEEAAKTIGDFAQSLR